MPLTQAASAGASCACRKRQHDEPGMECTEHSCGAAGSSPALGGKRRQPAAGADRQGHAAEASVAQSAGSAAQPQLGQQTAAEPEQQPAAEPEQRDQQGAAPPAAAEQQPDAELPPPPPPKLKPRRPFAPVSFYRQKAASGSEGGGGSGGTGGTGSLPSRAPTPRELYLETQVHRLLLAAKAREASWKEAETRHGPGAQPPPEVWETFPTQQPAFDRADGLGLDVFSVEYGREGKRRFIVASRAHFWQRYSGMVQRHYYEIIRAGAPCHLYFDLEFGREDNPGVDGAAAVDALLSLLRDALRDRFGLDMQDDWALELDSSTPTKFSRHLIVRVPGAAFASNAHVGALVLQLCAAAREQRGQDERCARLIVRKGEEEALFVDPAVYSRNRAFRLYLSSKSGKQTILDSTGRFGGAGLTQQETFFATLITDVPAGARLLWCFEGETTDEAAVAAGRRALSSRAGSSGGGGSGGGSAPNGRSGGGLRGGPPGTIGAHVSYGPCPYPELEQFVCSVCCEGGVQGRVRSWVQLEDVMLFSMRDNRWCGNVGRPHRSNGIYIVVDLREGSWHQKCYDPECRHYRSPLTPLPPELRGLWQPPPEPAAELATGEPAGDAPGTAAAAEAAFVAAAPAAGAADGTAAGGQAPCSWDDEEDCLMAEALDLFELQHMAAPTQQAQQAQHQAAAHVPQQQVQPQQAGPCREQRPVNAPLSAGAPGHGITAPGGCAASGAALAAAGGSADGGPEAAAAAAVATEPAVAAATEPAVAAEPEDDDMLLEGLLQYERQAAAAEAAVAANAAAAATAAAPAAMPAAEQAWAGGGPAADASGAREGVWPAAGVAGASPSLALAASAARQHPALAAAASAAELHTSGPAAAAGTPSSSVAAAAAASPATWPSVASSLRHIFMRPARQQQSSTPLQAAGPTLAAPWQQRRPPQLVAAAPAPGRKLEVWEKFL